MNITKIYGPPGTGKTTFLIDTLMSLGVPWGSVMFTSFTRKAIDVARMRAKNLGATDDDLQFWRTQNSINFRLLGLTKQNILTSELAQEFCKEYGYKISVHLFDGSSMTHDFRTMPDDFILINYNAARVRMMPLHEWIYSHGKLKPFEGAFYKFVRDYEDWKGNLDLFDFIDQIEVGLGKQLIPPVDYYFHDEAQDCSPLMFSQMGLWASHIPETYIAGDADQAIFSFAGASPVQFLDFPCHKLQSLTVSYRLPKKVLKIAADLINKNRDHHHIDMKTVNIHDGYYTVNTFADAVRYIKTFPRDMSVAILATTRFTLNLARVELKYARIPHGGSSDKMDIIKLFRSRPQVLTASDIKVLIGTRYLRVETKDHVGHFMRGARKRLEVLAREGFSPTLTSDMDKYGFTDTLIRELSAGTYDTLLDITRDDIAYYNCVLDDWDGNLNKVTLTTIHQFKGDEADIIILLRDVTYAIRYEEKYGDIEGARRVWYVALTRAKRALVVVNKPLLKHATILI